MNERPILSFSQIDAFDPQGPSERKWCPLCGEGKPRDAAHRSLSLDRQSGLWKCFRCAASGRAKEMWAQSASFGRKQDLAAAFSLDLPARLPLPLPVPIQSERELNAPQPKPDERGAQPERWRTLWEQTRDLEGTAGEAYLKGRGVSREVALLAGVRFSPRWSGNPAVVFPIRSRRGELIAAQGRAVRGSAKTTQGPKKEGAFFAPVTLGATRLCAPLDKVVPAIVLTEAPIDALSLAMCGFPCLALCGTSGPSWLHIACGLRPVALAFDNDDAGERATQAMSERLSPFGSRCFRLRPQNYKDWNEWLRSEGQGALEDFLNFQLLVAH